MMLFSPALWMTLLNIAKLIDMRKREIAYRVNKEIMNDMLFAMLGSDELVKVWWESPNKAFDMKCPKDIEERIVFQYLGAHCFGY